ncbi:PAS domain-containing protein [Mesorhizobium sp. 131-2-1]|uniref:PAS domain-containing protein n=1 Tax=Mesorhizobium sp. 131-2-1 TaxID=2744518 RepID=UPI001927ABBB|nr:PAS domain-containing protein [Mesorhizobium sp. 131-2-1]BCG94153.1 ATPase [Mesorhizobium sp. 131-2-1]
MMHVWSHRPQLVHLGLFFAAYVLGCGFAQLLAIVPGTGISIWPPSGLFIATLVLASRPSWPWWVATGCLAELFSNFLWFHSPLPAAFLIFAGNALEAVVGAWLVNLTCRRPVRLETLQEVLAFVILAAGVAPVASATVGSATLAWFGMQSQTFTAAWPLFWIGDATGVLIVAPLALVVFHNWRDVTQISKARWIEVCVLGLFFLGVATLSLSGYLPFAYIIMPPLLWAAVRFEFKGAAVALVLLALITAVFTISGASQFAGDPESLKQKHIMLQLFLAISAFSALIVAAISRQHQLALRTLRQSEGQLQRMIDALPVRVWSATLTGQPLYFNKRYQDHFRAVIPNFDPLQPPRIETLVQELTHPEDAAEVQRTMQNCFATGNASSMRFRWREKDGDYRWAECRVAPRHDDDGEVAEWYGVSLDIDDEVRAQAALRERERELSLLVDMVPVNIGRMAPDGEPTFFSKRTLESIGVDNVAALDRKGMSRVAAMIGATVHPEDGPRMREVLGHALATGEPYTMKYRRRRADGVYRWMEGRAEPLRNQTGTIVQWYVAAMDIDDEVRAQEALRDRERELAQLVDMVPSMLWRLSSEGEPTFFNKRLMNFLGLDIADADKPGMIRLSDVIETAVHPDDAAGLTEALNHCFVTGERFFRKYRLRRADGAYRWVEGSAEPLRDESGRILEWYGLTHDVHDQLLVEEALRRSERQLQQLIDTVPVQMWCVSPSGEPAYINKTMVDYIGLKLEDFDAEGGLPSAIETIVHPDDKAALLGALTHSFRTGEPFELKFRNRRWDGSYRWTEGHADPLRDESGRIIRWYGANLDIHDHVTSQEALLERERFLWQLVETLPAMIDCAAPDGEPVYRSQQLREFLGYDLEELDGTGKTRLAGTLDAGVHPDDVAGVKERYAHSLATGEPYARRHRLRRFDGEYHWVETRAAPMRNAGGAIVQWNVICLDIDGEVRMQEQLRLAQENLARQSQAASLAELSASIAHEVNQPLAAVVANSHACQRWLTADPPNIERAKKTVERVIRDANAAADVVSHIRALFKQSVETQRTDTTLSSVIAEALDLMAEEAGRRRVRINTDVEHDLPHLLLDRVQIQQVLVNLIRNGMDAMDSIAGERSVGVRVRRLDNVVQTEISDRGQGVEFPERIFEPFFTTKGHGMGMGLAICRSIVESHGGRLWVEANEPRGTTFLFTLPATAVAAP